MRKQILDTKTPETSSAEPVWLDLERLARVELSSEEAARPVEAALIPGDPRGWRAMHPGEQTIRLLFDEPLSLGISASRSPRPNTSVPRNSC